MEGKRMVALLAPKAAGTKAAPAKPAAPKPATPKPAAPAAPPANRPAPQAG
jgi:hypothetical protein